jgi:hypothetical protein
MQGVLVILSLIFVTVSYAGAQAPMAPKIEEIQVKLQQEEVARRKAESSLAAMEQKLKEEQATRQKVENALAEAKKQQPAAQYLGLEAEVVPALIRFVIMVGVVGVLWLLLRWIDLPSLLQKEAWSERTILALTVVFTFCAAALISLPRSIPAELKDIALVVIAFYFGASRVGREDQARQQTGQQPGQGKDEKAKQGDVGKQGV